VLTGGTGTPKSYPPSEFCC